MKMYKVVVSYKTCCDYGSESYIVIADSDEDAERMAMHHTQLDPDYPLRVWSAELTHVTDNVLLISRSEGSL